jgi:hypothetical protein
VRKLNLKTLELSSFAGTVNAGRSTAQCNAHEALFSGPVAIVLDDYNIAYVVLLMARVWTACRFHAAHHFRTFTTNTAMMDRYIADNYLMGRKATTIREVYLPEDRAKAQAHADAVAAADKTFKARLRGNTAANGYAACHSCVLPPARAHALAHRHLHHNEITNELQVRSIY